MIVTLRLWRRDTTLGVEIWDIEEYLPHVVAHEVSSLAWPMAALKAQAVAARCYAYYHKIYPKHGGVGADLCTETCCQYFRLGTTLPALLAVDGTVGIVLLDSRNDVIESEYSACCGGTIPGCPCNQPKHGHGRGMCQIGAKVMAQQGYTWQQILKFYYPHTHLSETEPIPPPPPPPPPTPIDRLFITALVLTTEPALTRAAREHDLGMPTTGEVTFNAYEDVDVVYQWWTGGVVWCVVNDWDNVEVIEITPPCPHDHVIHGPQSDWCADCGEVFAERQGAWYAPA